MRYKFDHTFFFEQNEKTAYFFGFCLADGTIQQNKRYRICIQIHKNDISILENFCDWINCDRSKIAHLHTRPVVSLELQEKKLFNNDFSEWGLVQNKTYNPVEPNITENLLKPFILGLLDGDGCIKYKNQHHSITLAGNNLIIDWYIKSLRKLGFDGKISIRKKNKQNQVYGHAVVSKKHDVIKIAKILEINKYNFLLDRKWKQLKIECENFVLPVSIKNGNAPKYHRKKGKLTGAANPSAKLTEDDVKLIKIYLKNGESFKFIKAKFNISRPTLYRIDKGLSWAHIV